MAFLKIRPGDEAGIEERRGRKGGGLESANQQNSTRRRRRRRTASVACEPSQNIMPCWFPQEEDNSLPAI